MKNLKTAAGIVFVFRTVYTAYSQDTLHLGSDNLEMVIANNQSYGELHRAGYRGVSESYLRGDSGQNLFVPFFSGLNLEFIFSGDSASYDWDIFEPRKSPMQLTRLASDQVQLKQLWTGEGLTIRLGTLSILNKVMSLINHLISR